MTSPVCTICGIEYTPKRVRKDNKFCSQKCKGRGSHLARTARGPLAVETTCTLDGCTRPSKWNGSYCNMHYRRQMLFGDPGELGANRSSRYVKLTCSVEGCDRPNYSNRLCSMHEQRKRITGDVGEAAPRRNAVTENTVWRWVDPDKGYVYLTFPGDRIRKVLEHRYVMEQHLGRPLWPDETVHHINGQRGQNNIENLELWSSYQPSGQRVEDKIAYAREILARYT